MIYIRNDNRYEHYMGGKYYIRLKDGDTAYKGDLVRTVSNGDWADGVVTEDFVFWRNSPLNLAVGGNVVSPKFGNGHEIVLREIISDKPRGSYIKGSEKRYVGKAFWDGRYRDIYHVKVNLAKPKVLKSGKLSKAKLKPKWEWRSIMSY